MEMNDKRLTVVIAGDQSEAWFSANEGMADVAQWSSTCLAGTGPGFSLQQGMQWGRWGYQWAVAVNILAENPTPANVREMRNN